MPTFPVRIERALVGLLLTSFVVLATGFSLGPIFEGPDEIEHYRYVRALAQTGRLPDAYAQERGEYHHAPLYYVLNVPIALLIDDTDFEAFETRLNPYYGSRLHIPGNDNKNLYLHTSAEAFPYRESETALTVHLMRLISVALGAITVSASYAVFSVLWPNRPSIRLLALSITVFWPQHLYLSSVVNNDNLLICLATIMLWLLLRQLRDGLTREGAIQLGVVLGLLLLTKVSALFIMLPLMFVISYCVFRNRHTWRYAFLTGLIAVLIAGWWYARNALLYGDPTNTQAMLTTWQAEVIRPGVIALDIGLERVRFAYQTLWARFGQGAVAADKVIYTFFDGLLLLAFTGLVVKLLASVYRRPSRGYVTQGALLVIFAVTWIGALVYLASTAWSGNQGRYLLPGIAAWAALIAFGLDAWIPYRVRHVFAAAIAVALGIVATGSLFGYFLPAYAVSPVPKTIARPVMLRFEGVAELIGMAPAAPRARPGETIELSLFWRAFAPADRSLQSYLHSAGSDVVRRDSIPATGNLLSTDWRAGITWAEHYTVTIPADAEPQRVYPLVAGLYDPAAGVPLPAEDTSGNIVTPVVGRIAITGPAEPVEPSIHFGDVMGLINAAVEGKNGAVEVCAEWVALAEMSVDYTMVARLESPDGVLIEQLDRQPRDGNYPTGAWTHGERVADCWTFSPQPHLPDRWQIRVGVYDPTTIERLAAEDSSGRALLDALVTLTSEPPD